VFIKRRDQGVRLPQIPRRGQRRWGRGKLQVAMSLDQD